MGRMRRQRRYKACDPFTRNKGTTNEDKYDLPPKGNDDDEHFKETKSCKMFQLGIQRAMSKGKAKKKKKNIELDKNVLKKSSKKLKDTPKESNMTKLPNETKKQYFERLDQNVQEAINTTMIETKTLRKKRKEHLKARNEKMKMKKQKAVADKEHTLTDPVKFGERVDAPPTITAAPRNTPTTNNKYQGLKLMSVLQKDGNQKSKSKRKDLTEEEKETLDIERQRAIDAYRLMKKRKNARYST